MCDYLSGPDSLTYMYSDKFGMRIYLFGDIHSIQGECDENKYKNIIDIEDYLFNELKRLSKDGVDVDMFLEDFGSFESKKFCQKWRCNSLKRTWYKFEDYFPKRRHYNPRTCKYFTIGGEKKMDNIHFHIADFRSIIRDGGKFGKEDFCSSKYFREMLDGNFSKEFLETFKIRDDMLKELKLVHKELNRVRSPQIKQKIIEFVTRDKYDYLYRDSALCVMDVYFLSRLFKKFNNPNRPYIKNAIIYAGSAHTDKYVEFLKELGFKYINFYTATAKNWQLCIDIKNFPSLFGNMYNIKLTTNQSRNLRNKITNIYHKKKVKLLVRDLKSCVNKVGEKYGVSNDYVLTILANQKI